MNQPRDFFKIIVIIFGYLFLMNILFLDFLFFRQKNLQYQGVQDKVAPNLSVIKNQIDQNQISDLSTQLIETIRIATSSLTQQVNTLIETTNKENTSAPLPSSITSIKVKEYYIPLGSGSSPASDWTDLSGVEAYVAPSNYGTIKEMYFEATLRVPSGVGKAYARLKNVTDSVGLYESEVFSEGTTGKLISSGKIPLPVGTKLFRVQLKSSLGSDVYLDGARIKLFIE